MGELVQLTGADFQDYIQDTESEGVSTGCLVPEGGSFRETRQSGVLCRM